MKCSLGISNFLEEISSLSHSIAFPFNCFRSKCRIFLSRIFHKVRTFDCFYYPPEVELVLWEWKLPVTPTHQYLSEVLSAFGIPQLPVLFRRSICLALRRESWGLPAPNLNRTILGTRLETPNVFWNSPCLKRINVYSWWWFINVDHVTSFRGCPPSSKVQTPLIFFSSTHHLNGQCK